MVQGMFFVKWNGGEKKSSLTVTQLPQDTLLTHFDFVSWTIFLCTGTKVPTRLHRTAVGDYREDDTQKKNHRHYLFCYFYFKGPLLG